MKNFGKTGLLLLAGILFLFQHCTNGENQGSKGGQTSVSNAPPNIIIIFADDLGYGDLGTFGHPTINTPNLDQMAREGMKFSQFYAAASVCTPSRAGLLTGRYPVRSGMASSQRRVLFPDSKGGLPDDEITIAEGLKEQGYATAAIGKWHLGHLKQYLPPNHGFDYYFGIPYSNDMRPANNDAYPPLPLIENTEVIETGVDQTTLTQRYTEQAVNFIKENQDQPFFLYYPQTFPHIPLYASDKFKGTSSRGLYGDVVEEIDWSVGQILDQVRSLDLAQNTLVFFTSDNGPWLVMDENGGSAGLLRGGKGATWEGGMREPTIAWWPGKIEPGQVSQALGSTMDLFTTSLSLAGASIPDDRIIDGKDLTPVLFGEEESVRDQFIYYWGEEIYAVRKGPWKAHYTTYTAYEGQEPQDHDPPLLFNLMHDPSEKYNKAEEHPEVLEELQQVVDEHKANLERKPTQLEARIED